jgi:secondary thiamine-phosphate synthase enzyme
MKQIFDEGVINTKGSGLYDFTDQIHYFVKKNKLINGILNINILHTSASLIIQENADPDVLHDLNNFFKKLVPMDNKLYKHTIEGKDDMPAHIKSALTNSHLTLSVKDKKIILGTWQGLYLFEHRLENQIRKISYHFIGN